MFISQGNKAAVRMTFFFFLHQEQRVKAGKKREKYIKRCRKQKLRVAKGWEKENSAGENGTGAFSKLWLESWTGHQDWQCQAWAEKAGRASMWPGHLGS